ncbi:hypothetical protein EJB05_26347, partial [Eragrostis curvula]
YHQFVIVDISDRERGMHSNLSALVISASSLQRRSRLVQRGARPTAGHVYGHHLGGSAVPQHERTSRIAAEEATDGRGSAAEQSRTEQSSVLVSYNPLRNRAKASSILVHRTRYPKSELKSKPRRTLVLWSSGLIVDTNEVDQTCWLGSSGDPDRPEAEAMQGFQMRLTNAPNQARQLSRDRLKDMNVL